LKWITSLDLKRWADSIGSRAALSELIRDLIRASVPNISDIRFPIGDSSQMPGWDGHLVSSGAPPYVPAGESAWEFGTDRKIAKKANGDYKTRSEDSGVVEKKDATFIFVTPRPWKSAKSWAKDRLAEGKWKDVRVIDAVGLEDWLGLCDAVAARIARELALMPQVGVRTTDQFWDEYATRFKPDLTEEVLLADRHQQGDQIVNQIRGTAAPYMWQADSTEEVLAFAVAAIRKAEPAVRRFVEDRTLIIDTEEAARQLGQKAGTVFLLRGNALQLAGMLAQRNCVIVPVGRDNPNQRSATLLEQPTTEALSGALKTMGFSEDDARRLAWNCGRSVTILARRIPNVLAQQPDWASHKQLIPALLAGSWSTLSEDDQKLIAVLAGVEEYAEYESQLLPYLRMQDSPILKEGDVWQVRAPVDAFAYLAHLVGAKEFGRLNTAATAVFSEIDPSLDLPEKDRPYATIYGKKLKYSGWLRDGIAKTLRLIAVRYEPLGLINAVARPDQFVEKLLSELPGLAADYRRLASLHGELPTLMEAAPRPLLAALEQMLGGDGKAIAPIFQDTDPLFSSSPHTGLLWALEALAWDPHYLTDATLILAGLARIDPGGKLMNRPINSLREIFLAWHPSTNATLAQRMSALDLLIAKEPKIGWDLVGKLLPGYHDVASPTAKPRYRDGGSAQREVLTRGLVARCYSQIVERALNLAGEDPQRWAAIIHNVSLFEPAHRARTIQLLEAAAGRFGVEQRTVIWSAVRDFVARHKAFPTADWAMKEADLTPFQTLLSHLEPPDPRTKIAWLFNEYHPRIPQPETPKFDMVDKTREAAIRSLLQTEGTDGLFKLADTSVHPEFVAVAAGSVVNTIEDFAGLIEVAMNKTSNLATFASVLSSRAEQKFGAGWRSQITLWRSQQPWTPDQFADLLFNWRDERQTWNLAASLGADVDQSYWKRKRPWLLLNQEVDDYQMAAEKYLDVGRAIAAIQALHYVAGALSAGTVFQMLDTAVKELNDTAVQPTTDFLYDLEQIFDSLQQRKDLPSIEIAQREYAYLPLFGYREKNLTLHQVMADDAHFYASLLCDAFKPSRGEPPEPTPERQARATAAYRLLSQFRTVPGTREGQIDRGKLREWVQEVRRLAKETDRLTIGEEFIGHVLASAPADPDGAWPHRIVRELVEDIASREMELGIEIEQFNMRGAHSRALYGGGGPEREIAEGVRQWAKSTTAWPRTTLMLERIAGSWESHAQREDERARQDRMRFES
jgi:hypothetical protein